MIRRLLLIVVILLLILPIAASAVEMNEPTYTAEGPIHTNKQEIYHMIADKAREDGYTEDSDLIQLCKRLWAEEELSLNIVAKVIKYEAGGCPWLHRIAVGQVVMNRVRSDLFPNTVFDVVNQRSSWYDENGQLHVVYQYSPAYCYNFEGIERKFHEDAKFVMDGNAMDWYVPSDIIWQAEFPQGKETWWRSEVSTPYYHSVTYFCR